MSISVLISSITEETKQRIAKELEIQIKNDFAPTQLAILYQISLDNTILYVPFNYGYTMGFKTPERHSLIPLNPAVKFVAKLRAEQNEVKKEALIRLNQKGCVLISSYCGFGKSITAIKLALCLKLRTLVVCNRVQLIKQWKESIERFCSSDVTVTIMDKKTQSEESSDFYIANVAMLSKLQMPYGIGLVIVDESHLVMAKTLARNLRFVTPRYLIGLTATPYRPDGFDILLTHYFGSDPIVRVFHRYHIVHKVKTCFVPVMETTTQGKLNWSVVINSLADNEERNACIAQLIFNIPLERSILVLVKRVRQGESIAQKLCGMGVEGVTTLMGTSNEFDREARILIGTVQKVGTGFDHDKMDTLVLASDVDEYFVQILGRIFRREDTVPMVYDIVDNQHILKKHFESRRGVYEKSGGEIRMFENFLK